MLTCIINQFMLAIQLSKWRSVAEQNSRIGVNFFKPLLKELNKFAIVCPKLLCVRTTYNAICHDNIHLSKYLEPWKTNV